MTRSLIAEAVPLGVSESAFLAGDGSLFAAIAGTGIRWIYCGCGADVKAEDWKRSEHTSHAVDAIERVPDWPHDCLLFRDDRRGKWGRGPDWDPMDWIGVGKP